MRRRSIALASAIVLALLGGRTGAQSQTASGHPDLSGYWEMRFDSFHVPRAVLTTAAQAATAARLKRDLDAIRGCVNVGIPALMNDRATLDIRQSASVIGMVAKAPSSTRYIYTDGRKHPDAEELEGTTNATVFRRAASDAFRVTQQDRRTEPRGHLRGFLVMRHSLRHSMLRHQISRRRRAKFRRNQAGWVRSGGLSGTISATGSSAQRDDFLVFYAIQAIQRHHLSVVIDVRFRGGVD